MDATIDNRLRSLPAELEPLGLLARRYVANGVSRGSDGTFLIGPAPWVGSEAFSLILFAPAEPTWLTRFEQRISPIPQAYAAVLRALNGCFAFQLSLCGLAPSMQADPPLLNRRVRQPHDLGLANTDWAQEYRAGPGEFHIGGREWSDIENIGYFVNPDGTYCGRLRSGEIVREWASLGELLEEELAAAESRDLVLRP